MKKTENNQNLGIGALTLTPLGHIGLADLSFQGDKLIPYGKAASFSKREEEIEQFKKDFKVEIVDGLPVIKGVILSYS